MDAKAQGKVLSFRDVTHGKVGDIIYPAYNGTSGFWKKPRWDLVLEVDKESRIIHTRYIWSYATIDALILMKELRHAKRKARRKR